MPPRSLYFPTLPVEISKYFLMCQTKNQTVEMEFDFASRGSVFKAKGTADANGLLQLVRRGVSEEKSLLLLTNRKSCSARRRCTKQDATSSRPLAPSPGSSTDDDLHWESSASEAPTKLVSDAHQPISRLRNVVDGAAWTPHSVHHLI